MAELHEDKRLPKWLRNVLIGATVVGVLAATTKGVLDLFPKSSVQPCKQLGAPLFTREVSALARQAPQEPEKFPADFELWHGQVPSSMPATIIAASTELRELEAKMREQTAQGSRLYFLRAPGGSGKTPLMTYLRKTSGFGYVNLTRLMTDVRNGLTNLAVPETELAIFEKGFSWQPKLRPEVLQEGLEAFVKRLAGEQQEFTKGLLIDSIDEIHPASAVELLKLVVTYSEMNPAKILIVAGRGEGFRDYFVENDLKTVKEIKIPHLYVGNEPLLKWYVADFVNYKDQTTIPDAKRTAEIYSGLTNLIAGHPFSRHFMYPGALGNFAIEHVRYATEPANRLEALMFQTLIDRNKGTHNRPSQQDAKLWTVYRDALVQIARRYAPNITNGAFTVGPRDVVCVSDGTNLQEVNVASVLARSGLVDLNPVNVRQLEFCFWPRTLHKFLADGKLE